VALDTVGWQIIERKRAEMELKTLDSEDCAPYYIATAADREHRLGTNAPGRLQRSNCSRDTTEEVEYVWRMRSAGRRKPWDVR
jgi:hypothetical protein